MRLLRNLTRRKLRTGLTIAGITIGIWALVVFSAMANKIDALVEGGSRYYADKVLVSDGTVSGFGLPMQLASGDARWRVLDQDAVSRALAGLTGFRRPPPPRSGAVGGPTFPGYDNPRPYGPGSAAPPSSPVPPANQWYASQLPSATLEPGETTSVLLFFETPARTLQSATFEIALVAGDGARLGTIALPFRKG